MELQEKSGGKLKKMKKGGIVIPDGGGSLSKVTGGKHWSQGRKVNGGENAGYNYDEQVGIGAREWDN